MMVTGKDSLDGWGLPWCGIELSISFCDWGETLREYWLDWKGVE